MLRERAHSACLSLKLDTTLAGSSFAQKMLLSLACLGFSYDTSFTSSSLNMISSKKTLFAPILSYLTQSLLCTILIESFEETVLLGIILLVFSLDRTSPPKNSIFQRFSLQTFENVCTCSPNGSQSEHGRGQTKKARGNEKVGCSFTFL